MTLTQTITVDRRLTQLIYTGKPGADGADGGGTFLELSDTPAAYAGEAGKAVVVTAGEDALEFVPATGTGDMTVLVYDTDDGVAEQVVGKTATQTLTNKTLTLPILTDNAASGAIKFTARSTEPSSGALGEVYLDDGTNTASGNAHLRWWNGTQWDDVAINPPPPPASGDISGSFETGALTIEADAVNNSKLATIAQDTIKGRVTAGTGDVEDLTATQVRTLINVADGADVTGTANVTAAGALMDSEVTNLAQVKAFDTTDYATAAQGTTADSATQPGDDADTLGSGAATDGQVLTADGIGGAAWEAVAGSGDVTGPASSTDNAIATFDSTTGKVIQQNHTDVSISDTDDITGVNDLTVGGNIAVTGTVDGIDIATDVGANTTHRTSDGSDHSFIDQSVVSGSSPTFDATNITGIPVGALPFGNAGEQLTTNEAETAIELVLASKYVNCRKASAGTINIGEPVYLTGWNAGGWALVELASSDAAGTMPALGLAKESFTNAATGRTQISGNLESIDTDPTGETWTEGEAIYVGSSALAGGITNLTNVKPVGSDLIQKIGIVSRKNGTIGSILVQGAGRSNDISNFTGAEAFWYGGASGVASEGTFAAGVRAFLETPSSANLATALTDETGSGGGFVRATSPTLVTPALGTPSSGALGSCTAYEGTAVASTGEAGGTKFLREDGDGTCSWQTPAGSGDMVLADVQTVTGAKTFGTIGGAVGKLILAGSTSGSTILNAAAVAGSTTQTLPSATGTLLNESSTLYDYLFVPAGAGIPRTTSGAEANSLELATNDIMIDTLDYDTAAEEGAGWWIMLPLGWDAGTILIQPYWTAASGSGTVKWDFAGTAYANSDAIDVALGTEQGSTDTLITANDVHIGPTTSALTLGGTPTDGEPIYIQCARDIATDTLGVDAKLLGFMIEFGKTTKIATAL